MDSVFILDKLAAKPENIPAGAVGVWVDLSGRVRTVDEGGVENPVGPNTATDLATTGTPVSLSAGAPPLAGYVFTADSPLAASFKDKFAARVGAEFELKRAVQVASIAALLDEWLLVDPGTAAANLAIGLPTPVGNTGRSVFVQVDGNPGGFTVTISGTIVLGPVVLSVEGEAAEFKSDGTSWRQVR